MKKYCLFLLFLMFVCKADEPSVQQTREEWLAKFKEQKVEEQIIVLSSMHYLYNFFDFTHKNKELLQKMYPYMMRNEKPPVTNEEKEPIEKFLSSLHNCPSLHNQVTEKNLEGFMQFIFGKTDTKPEDFPLLCIKNIDKVESMKKETEKIFNDARVIFLKKMEEQLPAK